MNAIADNAYATAWRELACSLSRPRAILPISVHWYVPDGQVTADAHPSALHDFGGFPPVLFDVQYLARGSPEVAARICEAGTPLSNSIPGGDRDWTTVPGPYSSTCTRTPISPSLNGVSTKPPPLPTPTDRSATGRSTPHGIPLPKYLHGPRMPLVPRGSSRAPGGVRAVSRFRTPGSRMAHE
jgi:hypothetical protein